MLCCTFPLKHHAYLKLIKHIPYLLSRAFLMQGIKRERVCACVCPISYLHVLNKPTVTKTNQLHCSPANYSQYVRHFMTLSLNSWTHDAANTKHFFRCLHLSVKPSESQSKCGETSGKRKSCAECSEKSWINEAVGQLCHGAVLWLTSEWCFKW